MKPSNTITVYMFKAKTAAPLDALNKIVLADGTVMRDSQTGADNGGRATIASGSLPSHPCQVFLCRCRSSVSMSGGFQPGRALLGRAVFACAILAGVLLWPSACISLHAQGQSGQAPAGGALANTEYNKLQKSGPDGPAPKRELTGSSAGPIQSTVPSSRPLDALRPKLLTKTPSALSRRGHQWCRLPACAIPWLPAQHRLRNRGIALAAMPDRIIVLNHVGAPGARSWMTARVARGSRMCRQGRARPSLLRLLSQPLEGR